MSSLNPIGRSCAEAAVTSCALNSSRHAVTSALTWAGLRRSEAVTEVSIDSMAHVRTCAHMPVITDAEGTLKSSVVRHDWHTVKFQSFSQPCTVLT